MAAPTTGTFLNHASHGSSLEEPAGRIRRHARPPRKQSVPGLPSNASRASARVLVAARPGTAQGQRQLPLQLCCVCLRHIQARPSGVSSDSG